jgi:hypothetical protein
LRAAILKRCEFWVSGKSWPSGRLHALRFFVKMPENAISVARRGSLKYEIKVETMKM